MNSPMLITGLKTVRRTVIASSLRSMTHDSLYAHRASKPCLAIRRDQVATHRPASRWETVVRPTTREPLASRDGRQTTFANRELNLKAHPARSRSGRCSIDAAAVPALGGLHDSTKR